jgi:hypothetical protein
VFLKDPKAHLIPVKENCNLDLSFKVVRLLDSPIYGYEVIGKFELTMETLIVIVVV